MIMQSTISYSITYVIFSIQTGHVRTMEDSFLIKPSSQEVVVSANQKANQNYVKNQHQKTYNDDNSLKYLPKMHNIYRLSSKERSYLALYGNKNNKN